MELLAALLNYRLVMHYVKLLRQQFPHLSIDFTFWSDSQITLYRIYSKKACYCQWLSNRLGEILEESTPVNWRWCPTDQMPADHGCRGLEASALTIDHPWIKGPDFMRRSPEFWPTNIQPVEPTVEDEDVRPPVWVGLVSRTHPRPVSDLINNSSELPKLIRTMARVLRFIHNCRSKVKQNHSQCFISKHLHVTELRAALLTCVRVSQTKCLREDGG
jgi:hypothetical protein